MELMVPINSPAYAGNAFFVSLYINNISLYKSLIESTSYFLNNTNSINNNNYLEIRPPNLTVDLTPKYENKVPSFSDLPLGAESHLFVSHSLTMDSDWGI